MIIDRNELPSTTATATLHDCILACGNKSMKASSGNKDGDCAVEGNGSRVESSNDSHADDAANNDAKARDSVSATDDDHDPDDDDDEEEEEGQIAPLTYLVSQKIILMGMGWMYFMAFYGAYLQNEGLMGSRGLVPSKDWFESIQERYGCHGSTTVTARLLDSNCQRGFLDFPSLFWWFDGSNDDDNTATLLLVGTTLSACCGLGLSTNSMAVWLILWILYFSVVTSAGGTAFYDYGWESQLLETGFLCVFLCQNWVWPSTNEGILWNNAVRQQQQQQLQLQLQLQLQYASPLVLWLFRWLAFRISIGAGMIKIRGDSCWTQKTCLLYHFETQPIPNPMSFVFHFLPDWMLRRAVDLDLFVQVYTSWFVLLPTTTRMGVGRHPSLLSRAAGASLFLVRLGGYIQVGFMANIALSGNMSMLNHLTILPALACLDDACYPMWLRRNNNFVLDERRLLARKKQKQPSQGQQPCRSLSPPRGICGGGVYYQWRWGSPRAWIDLVLWVGILLLSRPVVENLLELDGTHQKMNASFGSLRLVNSYGAFGSVGKQRYEPIVSVAYDRTAADGESSLELERDDDELEWIEIEFPCKPGSLDRMPCFCAPYHYRLDWNIWFIGFKPHSHYLNQRESWLYHLLAKILGDENNQNTRNDVDDDDFDDDDDKSNAKITVNANYWWAAKSSKRRRERPWLHLLDGSSSELLERRGPPLYAKVDMYRYEMAAPLWELLPQYFLRTVWKKSENEYKNETETEGSNYTVRWWNRYYEEPLLPVIAFDARRGKLVRAEL